MKAWHFTSDKLRDGRPIPPVGETLRHDGPLVLCESGLHASVRARDALAYAPGSTVHRVVLGGEILRDTDKVVASERTILWSCDAENVLRRFARLCALDMIHLWDAPAVVVRYLRSGDESLRAAARVAAWDAAWDAAWAAVRAAAWAAVRAAAWAAAWDAAVAAAWDAAGAAALEAARAAAWDAAWDRQNRRLTRMLYEAHRGEK